MKIIFIVYIIFLAAGAVLAFLRALQYWHGEAYNATTIGILLLAHVIIDFLYVGIIVGLWLYDYADEWSILFWSLIIVGVYTAILRLFENKLATGKFL